MFNDFDKVSVRKCNRIIFSVKNFQHSVGYDPNQRIIVMSGAILYKN